jgi:hypothetical protein
VPDFSELENEAKNLAGEHPDIADKAIQEAGQFAESDTGGRFDSEINAGEQQAEQFLGADQGTQDPQSGN